MAVEDALVEIMETGHALGFQRGLEAAARQCLSHPDENALQLAQRIRHMPSGPGDDKGLQDGIWRSYLYKIGELLP